MVAASTVLLLNSQEANTPSPQGRTSSQGIAAGRCSSTRLLQASTAEFIPHLMGFARHCHIMLRLRQSIRWLFRQMLPGEYLQDYDTKKKKKNADSPINSLTDRAQSGLRLQLYHRGASGIMDGVTKRKSWVLCLLNSQNLHF